MRITMTDWIHRVLVEEIGNINDMWLLGCVLYGSLAVCHYGGHHDIDGGTY